DSKHAVIDLAFADNLAFNHDRVANRGGGAVNNFGEGSGAFDGGNRAYFAQVKVGDPVISYRWQWNVFFNYRRIETDAVVDAFNDSDFHLGGTNAKGYTVGGNVALGRNTSLGLRWMNSTEVTAFPYAIDTVQIDLSSRF
ncbi:MAG TPA: putative porin, partial [Nevskiaceae bacterium]|nr:putative porin [Nevskiaceae bacterium]